MADRDEWEAVEYVREVLADIRQRLAVGATGPGVTLDADECEKLLACLTDPPYPGGRPPKDDLDKAGLKLFCAHRLREGVPLKAVVSLAIERFKCSRTEAYEACKPSKKV
jgi:hypothetical protein